MSECQCACHASSGTHRPACTIDRGSSGVPGVPSCSPCTAAGGPGCRVCGAATTAFLCKLCLRQIEYAVGDCTGLMHDVSVLATGQSRTYRTTPPQREDVEAQRWDQEQQDIAAWLRSREGRIALPSTRLMVNLDARDLLWRAGNTLSTWARHLLDARGADVPVGPACRSCVHWTCQLVRAAGDPVALLLVLADSIRFDEAAADMHDELISLRNDMQNAVDRSPDRSYAGPCTDCGLDLYRKPGHNEDDDEIVCDGYRTWPKAEGCGATYTVAERDQWLAASLATSHVPIDEMLAALPSLFPEYPRPPKSVVLAWVRQGRLAQHGQTSVGEPTYAGADLLELIRAYRPKRYAPRPTRRAS